MVETWLAAICIVVGVFFSVVASVGLLRMPDIFLRMHVATKTATLGVSSVLLAAALLLATPPAAMKVGLAILFQFWTAPTAAHLVGRAAHLLDTPVWVGPDDDSGDDAAGEQGSGETAGP